MNKNKYLKYKNKYIKLKNKLGGDCNPRPVEDEIDLITYDVLKDLPPNEIITIPLKYKSYGNEKIINRCYKIESIYKVKNQNPLDPESSIPLSAENISDINFAYYKLYLPPSLQIENNTKIRDGEFNSKNLELVNIPNSVIDIGQYAFAHNFLRIVVIPRSVKIINFRAFYDCKLETILFESDSNITKISQEAFIDNKLRRITIPKSVKSIEEGAFKNNKLELLTKDDMPNIVTIDSEVFAMNKLTSVFIPCSVKTIEERAFSNNELENIIFDRDSKIITIGEYAFSYNKLSILSIPNTVTAIHSYAFIHNKLEFVNISKSVTIIGQGAFYENKSLKEVIIPYKFMNNIYNIFENIFSIKFTYLYD